jgi:long-chain acyl-CoA synthetase
MTQKTDSIFATFRRSALAHRDRPALRWKTADDTERVASYGDLLAWVEDVAVGFLEMGIATGDRVAFFADNRPEWIVADLALLAVGAVDVPRGTDTPPEELGFIVGDSGSRAAVVAEEGLALGMTPAVALDESDELPLLEHIRTAGREASPEARGRFESAWQSVGEDNLATIIYTSGTTGLPKGVMLTHGNILHNVRFCATEMGFTERDRFLAILPPWHVYERTVEYAVLAAGACLCYSKPTPQALVQDIQRYRPTALVAVPRVWLSLKRAIQRAVRRQPLLRQSLVRAALAVSRSWFLARCRARAATATVPPMGTRLLAAIVWVLLTPLALVSRSTVLRKLREAALGNSLTLLISGGAGLPQDVDLFFSALGLSICEGYGLTETSPIVSVRRRGHVRLGTVGPPLPDVEVRIADEGGQALEPSQLGRVTVRGPLVMQGYYGRPEETARVIDADGWFDTGDLGMLTPYGELVITGRVREMLVLLGGENVHPQPLEQRILQSPLVSQVMVVGHGARVLGALVVPDRQALQDAYEHLSLEAGWAGSDEVKSIFKAELASLVGPESGVRPCERVSRLCLLEQPFRIGEELTQTLKLRRNVVVKKYAEQIQAMLGVC